MRVAVALSLLALTACVSSGTYQKKEAEAARLAEEVRSEQARRAELQSRFDAVQKDLDALSSDATALRERLKAHEATLTSAQSELERKQSELQGLKQRSAEYERMAAALKSQIDQGRVELTELRGRMTVKLKDKILFSSGSARVGRAGKEALAAVAGVLAGVENKVIRVEGHTDDVPSGGAYPTNWELSTARALAVLRFLQEQGIDPTRLAAAGYGEYRPIAPNDTPEGRSQNRRIEIVLAAAEDAPPAELAEPKP
jgi:chemotaxis protein MotB